MIGKRQLALFHAGCAFTKLSEAEIALTLREEGRVDRAAELSLAGFNGVMDRFTVLGFRDRRRPVLSPDTRQAVEGLLGGMKLTAFETATYLRHYGRVGDLRDLAGDDLLNLLMFFERNGRPVADFVTARRSVTRKQLGLLHLAIKQVEVEEGGVSWALQHLGGVNSAADLDQRGFDLLMAMMRGRGFKAQTAADAVERPAFGQRPGFATPAQVNLIRTIWGEWSGSSDEGALNAWLERFHQVSSLRFLTSAGASNAITALKAMKRRKVELSKATA